MVWRDNSGRPVDDVREQVMHGLIDGEEVIELITSNAGIFTPRELNLAREVLATVQAQGGAGQAAWSLMARKRT